MTPRRPCLLKMLRFNNKGTRRYTERPFLIHLIIHQKQVLECKRQQTCVSWSIGILEGLGLALGLLVVIR